jgi:hypothetical protein
MQLSGSGLLRITLLGSSVNRGRLHRICRPTLIGAGSDISPAPMLLLRGTTYCGVQMKPVFSKRLACSPSPSVLRSLTR